ncbi:RagB/SusD family nutrient uptake outer membrane protein [termite gut metagenome]|uniref:RagB/SusD family nutrient uptake outer membrane protein n=1 Tax=termite gut metagenome TaxID=433724 RepID=A0A5J4SP78_9ZZZZ
MKKIQSLKLIVLKAKSSFIVLSVLLCGACSDVLNVAPDGTLTMDEILSNPDRVEALLNSCYNNIPQKGYSYQFFDPLVVASSDDGWSSDDGADQAVSLVYRDNTSAGNHPMRDFPDNHNANVFQYWTRCWTQIRLCSQFIELIDQAAVKDEANRERFKAEAHLLRAFFYSELVKWFGKVPILDHTVPFDTDFSLLRRASVYDIAQFIGTDCDVAITCSELPWRIAESNNAMRVTKALAHAIKAKMMLFAASPLHNEGQNHWEEAYTVCQTAVNQLKSNGYELFKTCTDTGTFGTSKAAAYRQLACQSADESGSPRDKETIWQAKGGEVFVWHIGYVGSSMDGTYKCGTGPTQELVDAYETDDGVPVLNLATPYADEKHLQPNYNTANTKYDRNNPYANRDPRMNETVLHNGSTFLWNNGEKWTIESFAGGKFAPSFDQSDREHSRTGYYHCKMVTPGACLTRGINNARWKFYRLGELLLDYAEAAAEAGHLAEARAATNEVRDRVGMPGLPDMPQSDLILRIRNERRVELAWEEQRYFDLRRWQTPQGDLSATCKWLTAMTITKNGGDDGSLAYTRVNITTIPRGGWQNKDLLLPLPLNEVSRLEPLTGVLWQNPGW